VRALDSRGVTVPSALLISGASTLTMAFQDAIATATNVIVGPAPSLAASYSYAVPLQPVAFGDSVTADILFRVRNSAGCSVAASGCRLAVLVGGRPLTPPTFVQTAVRSIATRLVARCSAALASGGTFVNGTVGVCPGAKVHEGVAVQLEARDGFGNVDEFFAGTIYAVVGSPVAQTTAVNSPVPTRVSALTTGTVFTSVVMTAGRVLINDFTLTRACPTTLCNVTFFSDRGTGYATILVNITQSTTMLSCAVNASKVYYLKRADGTGIVGRYTSGQIGSQSSLLIYPDTDVCFEVRAIDALQQRTLYETIWAHWTVRTSAGVTVTATPSPLTPTRYRFMTRSQVEFCLRVDGVEGSDFSVQFIAQAFGSNWAAGAGGRCTTPSFTVSRRRFIGALRIQGTSGLTELPGFASPSTLAWGYKELTTPTETVSVIARFAVYDHYGSRIASNNIAAAHSNFALTAGTCLPSDMTLGTCQQSTSSTSSRSIAITTPHAAAEGGMLGVSIISSTTAVSASSDLTVQLAVRQWCLSCTVTFGISSASGAYIDPANGAVAVSLRMSLILPASTPTYVAFAAGNSPLMPPSFDRSGLLRSYWPYFVNSSGARPVQVGATPVLVHRNCFAAGTSCPITDVLFSYAYCSSDAPTQLTGNNGEPMRLFAVRSVAPPRFGEPWCTGDCLYQSGTTQSQVDIFNTYTISVTAGAQTLLCTNGWCAGTGTSNVSRSIAAAGSDIPTALIAAHNNGFNRAAFTLVGMQNSAAYNQDLSTDVVPAGTTPNLAGVLQITATGTAGASPVALTSSHALGDDGGDYLLVWRGPRLVKSLVIADSATPATCVNDTTYNFFSSPTTGTTGASRYTGYLSQQNLTTIAYSYATTVAEAGVPFPVTVELRDASGVISANTEGTVLVKKLTWSGCGDGGTLTVVNYSSAVVPISNGKATFWIAFSAPCSACRFSVTLSHSTAQTRYFGDLAFDDLKRQVISKPFVVRRRLANSASTVFVTSNRELQSATVSVTDLITVTAATYGRVGSFAYADTASTFEISAYNTIQGAVTASTMFTVGNGGVLRPQTTAPTYGQRHNIRARGVGTATLSFAYQRTCASCFITIAWTVLDTNTAGSFTLQAAGGAISFTVTAPIRSSMVVGYAPGTVRKYEAFTLTVWSMVSAAGLPFAGLDPTSPPQAVPAALTQVTTGNGDGGALDTVVNRTGFAVIYHLRTTASCDLCSFTLGSVVHNAVIATTATHYRIQSMSPRLAALNAPITIEAYASDDEGYVDVTIGGQADCAYVDAFFCDQNSIRLAITASQSGRVPSDFYPTSAFITRGGPTQTDFDLAASSTFLITNGQTATGGTTFKVTGSPVSSSIPIISDAKGLSSASYPTFAFSTDIGLSDLVLMNDRPGADAQVFQPFSVLVAFTKQTSAGSSRFIVSNADNTIRVDPSGECNYVLQHPSIYVKMVNGVANVTFIFTKKSVGGTCQPQFTVMAGNGQCRGSNCVTTADIRAFELEATSWNFKRPSAFENDLAASSVVGPRYAVAGRAQMLNPQLYQIFSTSTTEAMTCRNGCLVTVTSLQCSPSPTISPSGGATFNQNGTASISVAWPLLYSGTGSNASLQSYSCTLVGAATGGIDPPTVTTFTVQVCNPTRISLAVNGSKSAWASGILETGQVYALDVSMLDASGQLCRGDSQYGISTVLEASVVDHEGRPITSVSVININTTTSTAPGATPQAFNNTVYLAGGRFRFQLVFTSATAIMNLTKGIRVRVTAKSSAPPLNVQAFTPIIQVISSHRTIRWESPPPLYVSRARSYSLSLVGTNAIPDEWLALNGGRPSIGNTSARIAVRVDPSFRRQLPVTVTGDVNSVGEITLVRGVSVASFAFTSVAEDREYVMTVANPINVLNPDYPNMPAPRRMILQTPTATALLSLTFRPGAPHACTTECMLPKEAFDMNTSLLVLNTTQGKTFNFSVFVSDATGQPVLGETDLVMACRVVTPRTRSSVILGQAPSLITRGVLTARVVDGYANFSAGLMNVVVGNATLPTSGIISENVRIRCGCQSGLCPANIPEAESMPITVRGLNMSLELRAAYARLLVVKVATSSTALSKISVTALQSYVIKHFFANGVTLIDAANADDALQVAACLVNRDLFAFSDLYGTVCGATRKCTTNLSTCPNQVVQCSCTGANTTSGAAQQARFASREDRLFNARQLAAQDVQLEIAISLANVPAFFPESAADVEAMYVKLQLLVVDALSKSALASYGILIDTVLISRPGGNPNTAPPPPPTLAPLTPSPPRNASTSVGAATAVQLGVLPTLVAVLLMLCCVLG
jgi:hypothetical protein